jgi:diketogulonate reductase-like aldo/keto reductase
MSFTLPKNELGIPELGIGSGTYYFKREKGLPANEKLVSIFTTAIKEGFIHLDSAECYGNDIELKEALKKVLDSGIKRENIFITDKYFSGDGSYTSHSEYANPYDRLKKLTSEIGTPYIDLYLLHAPFIKKETHGFDLKEAWNYMQQAKDEGLAKIIGVSNFTVDDIKQIWDVTATNPQVNQIEFNAFLQNQTPGIVEFCQSNNIVVEAYSPLAPITSADLTQGPGLNFGQYLESLAVKYQKTKMEILLRWVIQRGIVPITTTSKVERFTEMKGIFGWELDISEVDEISKLGSEYKPVFRKYWKPEFGKYDNEL